MFVYIYTHTHTHTHTYTHTHTHTHISCYCSVTKSRLTLCDPIDCSTPGSSFLHYLLEEMGAPFLPSSQSGGMVLSLEGQTVSISHPSFPSSPSSISSVRPLTRGLGCPDAIQKVYLGCGRP